MSRSALYQINPDHPIPVGVWAPKAVAKPAARARELYEQLREARAAARSLSDQADAAKRADRIAYRSAAASGDPMPEPTEPRLREEAAEARRCADAFESVLRDALVEQAQAVAASHAGWTAHVCGDLDKRATKIRGLLEQLGDEFAALETDVHTAGALEEFDGHPQWFRLHMLDTDREQRAREKAERSERLRTRSGYVDSSRHALIAALERMVADSLSASPATGEVAATGGAIAGYPEGLTVGS